MDTDFFIFFIFTPSMIVVGFILCMIIMASYKKKERKLEELRQHERELEMERLKEEWKKKSEYLDAHPAAEKAYWEEVERQCRLNEKFKRPIKDDYTGHFAQIF